MASEVEVKIRIYKLLGAASVFRQGGSLRLILPKKAFGFLKMPKDPEESEFATVIMIATDKGILIRPLSDLVKDEEMKNI